MLTLPSILQRAARNFGANIAVRTVEGNMSWKAFADRIARIAGGMRTFGVRPGDRFAILTLNNATSAELMYAGYWMGAIPIPLNYKLAAPEIARILTDANCCLLVIEQGFAHHLDHPPLKTWQSRALAIAPGRTTAPLPSYDILVGAASAIDPIEPDEDDQALILYTGTPSGHHKGVCLSHRNIVASAMQLSHAMAIGQVDIYLHTAPMFNASALKATTITMHGGAHLYMGDFSAPNVLRTIERHRATIVPMVRPTLANILEDPDFAHYNLSSIRLITYAGSRMEPELVKKTMNAFPGVDIHQCYGFTETASVVTLLDERDHHRAAMSDEQILRSVGRPLAGVDLRIVDDAGRETPAGTRGEIVVRGPQVSNAYYGTDTKPAPRSGWFHTGDIGHVDAAGYVYIDDHKSDVIVYGSERIYCEEIDAVLAGCEGVQEAAVIGIPNPVHGEIAVAFIVPIAGATLNEPDVIRHARQRIGRYKIPRRIVFVGSLPKDASGAISKDELRRRYQARPTQEVEHVRHGETLP